MHVVSQIKGTVALLSGTIPKFGQWKLGDWSAHVRVLSASSQDFDFEGSPRKVVLQGLVHHCFTIDTAQIVTMPLPAAPTLEFLEATEVSFTFRHVLSPNRIAFVGTQLSSDGLFYMRLPISRLLSWFLKIWMFTSFCRGILEVY